MSIKQIGVVGGGVMGAGIAQTFSSFDCPVYIQDISDELVRKSIGQVEKIYLSAVKKGRFSEEQAKRKVSLIKGGTGYEGFDQVDLVIEAVPEKIPIKKEVFTFLDRICKPDTILATNTSSLSVSLIGTFTSRSNKVIGMHWFNPPHIMKLVEVIPGIDTSREVVQSTLDLCVWLGKVPVEVKECAGFLVNRLLGIYANEALYMLEEQFPPELVDQAALDLGMPMGPLRLGDMAGWDVIYHANQSLHEEYGTRFTLPCILPDMIKAGKLGQKVGDGVYLSDKVPSVELASPDDARLQDLSDRLLYVMLNEGIRCLEEGVASAKDIDLAMQLGTGMPRGPITWADELGLDVIFDGLEQLKARHGERYRPSPLLRRKVQAGHLGKKSGKGLNISK